MDLTPGFIERTRTRPMANGEVAVPQVVRFLGLQLSARLAVLAQLNWYGCIYISFREQEVLICTDCWHPTRCNTALSHHHLLIHETNHALAPKRPWYGDFFSTLCGGEGLTTAVLYSVFCRSRVCLGSFAWVVGGCGVGELDRVSPVVCGWYRVDVGLRYGLCPPGKPLVLRTFSCFPFPEFTLFPPPTFSEARFKGSAAELQVGPFGLGLTHSGQPVNKPEHLHYHCRLFAFG